MSKYRLYNRLEHNFLNSCGGGHGEGEIGEDEEPGVARFKKIPKKIDEKMISFLHLCLLCLIPFVCMASKLELKNVFLDAQIQSMMIYREDQGMYHPIGRISDLKPIVEHPTGYETSSTVIYAHEEYIGKFQGAIHEEVTLTVQGLTTDNAFLSMVKKT